MNPIKKPNLLNKYFKVLYFTVYLLFGPFHVICYFLDSSPNRFYVFLHINSVLNRILVEILLLQCKTLLINPVSLLNEHFTFAVLV